MVPNREASEEFASDLARAQEYTVQVLGRALAVKDMGTEDHSKRVSAYSTLLAKSIGLSSAEIEQLSRGAFLHDIGKIAIPADILNKHGKLSVEEQELMRTHSRSGYEIVRKVPFLTDASRIILHHHECFDGSGYPDGLCSDEIPIGARIFAVVDALDAITTNRPYRNASSFSAARKEIIRCSGRQFDPMVVEAYVKIPHDAWDQLRMQVVHKTITGSAD